MLSPASNEKAPTSRAPDFAFLTNHGKTLLLIAHDRRIRMRDIAGLLNITERATQRIIADLAKAGYIDRERDGRRNLYSVRNHLPLGLPTQRDIDIGTLLAILPAHDEPEHKTPA
jgi:MarR family